MTGFWVIVGIFVFIGVIGAAYVSVELKLIALERVILDRVNSRLDAQEKQEANKRAAVRLAHHVLVGKEVEAAENLLATMQTPIGKAQVLAAALRRLDALRAGAALEMLGETQALLAGKAAAERIDKLYRESIRTSQEVQVGSVDDPSIN